MIKPIYHVCIIYPSDPLGPKIGGGETFLKGFVQYSPDDFLIEYIGVTSDPERRPSKRWSDIKLAEKSFRFYPVFLESNENKKTLIPIALRFTAALKIIRFDFTRKAIFFNRIEPALFYKRLSSPKIVIVHNDIEKQIMHKGSDVFWSKLPWIYFKVEKYILSFMDCIYSVSQESVDYYCLQYPKLVNRIHFLPTWVDRDIFQPSHEPKIAIRQTLGFSENNSKGKWILFVGRLQEQKAPHRLLDVFRDYTRKDNNARLILVGEGNLKDKIEERIKVNHLEGRVLLLNGMPQNRLIRFYQAADMLLLTSNYEGMPICILEALACGLPVVSTDVGEVRRVIKNGYSGEVANSFALEHIRNAVEKVLSHPDNYLKENCCASIVEYSPQRILGPVYDKIRTIYQERFCHATK